MIIKKSDSCLQEINLPQFNFEAASNQREFLLAKLKQRPVTTLASRQWSILSPSTPRMMELKKVLGKKGYDICKRNSQVTTAIWVKKIAIHLFLLIDWEVSNG